MMFRISPGELQQEHPEEVQHSQESDRAPSAALLSAGEHKASADPLVLFHLWSVL